LWATAYNSPRNDAVRYPDCWICCGQVVSTLSCSSSGICNRSSHQRRSILCPVLKGTFAIQLQRRIRITLQPSTPHAWPKVGLSDKANAFPRTACRKGPIRAIPLHQHGPLLRISNLPLTPTSIASHYSQARKSATPQPRRSIIILILARIALPTGWMISSSATTSSMESEGVARRRCGCDSSSLVQRPNNHHNSI
jgi:hypothetical protein